MNIIASDCSTQHSPTRTLVKTSLQKGFTLIELMVAIVIATLLMLGLVEIFGSARASYNLQEGLGRLQENARFANTFISRAVRETGYFPIAEVLDPNTQLGFVLDTTQIPAPIDQAISQDGGGTNPDTLAISTFTDRDCNGQPNPNLDPRGRPAFFRKLTIFSIAPSFFNRLPSLQMECRYGPVGGPLAVQFNETVVQGIETLQVQYGIDTDVALDENANAYVDTPANVPQLVTLRVGMIVSTDITSTNIPDDQPIDMMGLQYPAAGDRRIRKPIVSTFTMRNFTP
jgi:prepilin-type N-terminal cleavage/methylation domain-containing protein